MIFVWLLTYYWVGGLAVTKIVIFVELEQNLLFVLFI